MSYFEKVSFEQFKKDMLKQFGCEKKNNIDSILKNIWDNLVPPTRSTSGSAGYDFKAPFNFILYLEDSIIIPTGYRCVMDEDDVLMIYPRSGQGFKHRFSICNTVGVIDSDYWKSSNEGHIMIKLVYDGVSKPHYDQEDTYIQNDDGSYTINASSMLNDLSYESVEVRRGDGFAQGVITKYCVTDDDAADGIRDGGFGSTDKK